MGVSLVPGLFDHGPSLGRPNQGANYPPTPEIPVNEGSSLQGVLVSGGSCDLSLPRSEHS